MNTDYEYLKELSLEELEELLLQNDFALSYLEHGDFTAANSIYDEMRAVEIELILRKNIG
jgi:pentatricopeptide repeat protein